MTISLVFCPKCGHHFINNPYEELIQKIRKRLDKLPECWSKECMGCEWDLVRNELEKLLIPNEIPIEQQDPKKPELKRGQRVTKYSEGEK